METFDAISTKLDVREFGAKHVEERLKVRILEAARLTASSMNSQHWRFILVQDPRNLEKLAMDSTSGRWVGGADFAIVVTIDPGIPGSSIDAGRAVQDMQLAAWDSGIVSCVFTGIKKNDLRKDFDIPDESDPAIIIGFGFPKKKIVGRKSRKALSEVAFLETYGHPLDLTGASVGRQ